MTALPESGRQEVARSRGIEHIVHGVATRDGAGVRLTRVLTQDLQQRLDPFLMLDAFGSDHPDDYIGGFPDHPHRGFETVTYMLAGRMRHRDSAGHEGLLEGGGVQWMTAGRGIVHSEIPEQESGLMEGFQLWLNLPAAAKMTAPWYRDFAAAELPRCVAPGGVEVTVIAGDSGGVAGAVRREVTQPLFLDLQLPAGGCFAQALPADHNAFVYVYRGAVTIAGDEVAERQLGVLGNEAAADGVVIAAAAPARLLLLAGRPLGEPIVQYGPFVMNSEQEVYAALRDYREGRLGAA